MTTPFDDPQAELAWMFLQNLGPEGDLDEGFSLLSDDFTYWSNHTEQTHDKAALRLLAEQMRSTVALEFTLVRCLNEGESVVIEARTDGVTSTGEKYSSPTAFLFDTRNGVITALREYGDTRLPGRTLDAQKP